MCELLEVKGLNIKYSEDKCSVENADLVVGNKEIVAIVGESGSGKTTLIRAIINMLSTNGRVDSGEIIFNGRNLLELDDREWNGIRGNAISMIFQNPGSYLSPITKIGKQFEHSIRSHEDITKEEALLRAEKALDRLGFDNSKRVLNSYPFQLSGGMKQRVAIAMSIVMSPQLILADEPTSALDVVTRKQIAHELLSIRENFGTSIIMVTHDIGLAAYIADRIVVMKDGHVVETGMKRQIMENPKEKYTIDLLNAVPKIKGCKSELRGCCNE